MLFPIIITKDEVKCGDIWVGHEYYFSDKAFNVVNYQILAQLPSVGFTYAKVDLTC
jgi:hypothetical protein